MTTDAPPPTGPLEWTLTTPPEKYNITLSWFEFELLDEDDEPIPKQRFIATLADGTTIEGELNDEGVGRIEDVPDGECTIDLPDLDKSVWEPIED